MANCQEATRITGKKMSAKELKAIRAKLKLSPIQMALKLGVTLRDYSLMEEAKFAIPEKTAQYLKSISK